MWIKNIYVEIWNVKGHSAAYMGELKISEELVQALFHKKSEGQY